MIPRIRLPRRKFLLVLMTSMLAACGGGGGGSNRIDPPAPPQDPPPRDPPQTSAPPPQPKPGPDPQPEPEPQPEPVPRQNVIQLENAKTAAQGVTSEWLIADRDYARDREIEGYASATSVNRGESISLYVSTSDPSYTISVYRIGWYGGMGGRLVAGPIIRSGFRQAPPSHDHGTHLVECDWTDPYLLSIPNNRDDPTDWASGIYLAKLTGNSSGKQSYIIFVVRDDARSAALLFQASVTTYAAYNNWGGHSFYAADCVNGQQAVKVSFNRPYRNPQRPCDGKGAGDFLSWEIYMLRFAEREGFDLAYTTNIAVHMAPHRLQRYRGFLSVGHDEYWTASMYDAMENARDAGVNLAFLGANMGYWQVRLEPDTRGRANRTVVGYKYAARPHDPLYGTPNAHLSTFLWREVWDPPVNRPESALIGVMYDYNSVDLDMVMSDCSSWICEGTGLQNGAVLRGMLGYEVDRVDPVNSPRNIHILASSPYEVCVDEQCATRETRHANMTWYTAPSGAGVFATGSMQWNWGLDGFAGPWGNRTIPAVQRMTRNVLKRFVRG